MSRSNEFHRKYGPWAVLTGASDGIGRAFAVALARRGLNLVLVARRLDRLNELATDLSRKHHVEVRTVGLDLSVPGSIPSLAKSTEGIDVGLLIAAAGFGTSGLFLDQSIKQELELLDVVPSLP